MKLCLLDVWLVKAVFQIIIISTRISYISDYVLQVKINKRKRMRKLNTKSLIVERLWSYYTIWAIKYTRSVTLLQCLLTIKLTVDELLPLLLSDERKAARINIKNKCSRFAMFLAIGNSDFDTPRKKNLLARYISVTYLVLITEKKNRSKLVKSKMLTVHHVCSMNVYET